MSTLAAEELASFAEAITARFGHTREQGRHDELETLLARRMTATRSRDFDAYRTLLGREDGAEWEALAPLLTVPETYFFRMPAHFDALAEDVLPELIRCNAATRTLRILSAGCASGEEAYTVRILLNERFPELRTWRVEIVGVDLSPAALDRARAGVYTAWSLRATSAERRVQNFAEVPPKLFRLKAEARVGVAFHRENLLAAAPAAEPPFDVVFCRNVLIYFTSVAIEQAIARLAERLRPGGYLFLGPAESLRGVSRAFQLCQGRDVFYYRLREPEQPAADVPGQQGTEAIPPDPAWYSAIAASWQRLHTLVGHARPHPAQPHAIADDSAVYTLLAEERYPEALARLETLRALEDTPALRLARAAVLNHLGRAAEAQQAAEALTRDNPEDAGAHYLLGLCHEQADNLGLAREHMARAAFLDPGFSMAHLYRGLLARRMQDDAAAHQAFTHALRALDADKERRLALFGGGFSRASLRQLCERELGVQP